MRQHNDRPILAYFHRPAECLDWDSCTLEAARHVSQLIESANPQVHVDHVGSTAAPGCPGKGVLDLLVIYPEGALDSAKQTLQDLGFQPQSGRDPFPEDRPMRVGA